MSHSGYQLIDFGNFRKLERFAELLVDRPCPAASGPKMQADLWSSAELIYDSPSLNGVQSASWNFRGKRISEPDSIPPWTCEHAGMTFQLRPQRSGQIGLFPEHWAWWPWLEVRLDKFRRKLSENASVEVQGQHPKALHLFAYTGASTLALAGMGMEVTHIDAMDSAVAWGRENASLSNLQKLPIRWIVDDARAYVARELRRGKKYDWIVLDPPSYGHGAKGQAWEIHRDLLPLLINCCELLSESAIGIQLSGHSRDVDLKRLCLALNHSKSNLNRAATAPIRLETAQAKLVDASGRGLDCGYVARFLQ